MTKRAFFALTLGLSFGLGLAAPAGAQVIGKCERIGGGATVQHANGVTEELKANDNIRRRYLAL